MRREELYLRDIVEAADHIAAFVTERGETGFQESEMVRSAIVQKLAIIGEAASRVSEEMQARHTDIPWPQVVAFRNILVHAYFGIDLAIIWRAATVEAPMLRNQIAAVIETEFPL